MRAVEPDGDVDGATWLKPSCITHSDLSQNGYGSALSLRSLHYPLSFPLFPWLSPLLGAFSFLGAFSSFWGGFPLFLEPAFPSFWEGRGLLSPLLGGFFPLFWVASFPSFFWEGGFFLFFFWGGGGAYFSSFLGGFKNFFWWGFLSFFGGASPLFGQGLSPLFWGEGGRRRGERGFFFLFFGVLSPPYLGGYLLFLGRLSYSSWEAFHSFWGGFLSPLGMLPPLFFFGEGEERGGFPSFFVWEGGFLLFFWEGAFTPFVVGFLPFWEASSALSAPL